MEWRTLRFVHVTQLCRTSPALGVVMTLFSDPDILGGGECREDPSHSQFAAPRFLELQSQVCNPYSNFKLFHSRLDFLELFTSNHP